MNMIKSVVTQIKSNQIKSNQIRFNSLQVRVLYILFCIRRYKNGATFLQAGTDLGRRLAGCVFIYPGSARRISCEVRLISKEISRAEPKYINIYMQINVLDEIYIKYTHTSVCKQSTGKVQLNFWYVLSSF